MTRLLQVPGPGDYGVCPGGGPLMFAVRLWTGDVPFLKPAWAGHAGLVRHVTLDPGGHLAGVLVSEATPDQGIRERWVEGPALAGWRWSTLNLSPTQRAAAVKVMDEYRGTPYDWPSVVEVGLRVIVARYRGQAADHPDKRLFCSEWVSWVARDFMHLDLFPGIAPGTVSPHMLDRRRAGPLTAR